MVNIQYTVKGFEYFISGKVFCQESLAKAIAHLESMGKSYHVPANTRPSARFVKR